jgi:hypothetical protein
MAENPLSRFGPQTPSQWINNSLPGGSAVTGGKLATPLPSLNLGPKASPLAAPSLGPKPWPISSDKVKFASDKTAANAASTKSTTPTTSATLTNNNSQSTADTKSKLGENILNKYRSYTYNFTLAGLEKSIFNSSAPILQQFEEKSKNLIILRSAGKGNSIIKPSASANPDASQLINGFNKNSPGQFDMYMENVEIETMFTFNKDTTVTMPIKFRFDVYEPYSMSGFIEALHVTAVAAGYNNYAEASFILKMNFSGYPDTVDAPQTPIDKSTRYYVIKFSGFQVDVTDRGTRYTCTAFPWTDQASVDTENRLKQNLQIVGLTLDDILTNFSSDLTNQRARSDRASRDKDPGQYDDYKIEFASSSDDQESELKRLKESIFNKLGQENQAFIYTNPQDTTVKTGYDGRPSTQTVFTIIDEAGRVTDRFGNVLLNQPAVGESKPDNASSVINFAENTNITDCISAVIVGSSWYREFLSDLPNRVDPETGMVSYFSIRFEMENKPNTFNDKKNRPYQIFKYIVSPYKIHWTKVPVYEKQQFNFSKNLAKLAYRKYEYTYTGNNVDILNFKIHFDNLYYEVIARGMGNSTNIGFNTSMAPLASTEISQRSAPSTEPPPPPGNSVDKLVRTQEMVFDNKNPTAAQPLWSDPYYIMSKTIHESIINSYSGMIRGNMDILGDPMFLVMDGQGNYRPKSDNGITSDGSVDRYKGQVFIQIEFKNPKDIKTFEDGGVMKLNDHSVSFSGVYMVTRVVNKFNNGVFKQTLDLIRMMQTDKTSDTPKSAIVTTATTYQIATDAKPLSTTQIRGN